MAMFKVDKLDILTACEAYLEANDRNDLWIDYETIQRLYDCLKGKVYAKVNSVLLDDVEIELLSDYFDMSGGV